MKVPYCTCTSRIEKAASTLRIFYLTFDEILLKFHIKHTNVECFSTPKTSLACVSENNLCTGDKKEENKKEKKKGRKKNVGIKW